MSHIGIEPAETFNENHTAYTGGTMPLLRAAEKILGGPEVTRLAIAGGACLLLLAFIIIFTHGVHRHWFFVIYTGVSK